MRDLLVSRFMAPMGIVRVEYFQSEVLRTHIELCGDLICSQLQRQVRLTLLICLLCDSALELH